MRDVQLLIEFILSQIVFWCLQTVMPTKHLWIELNRLRTQRLIHRLGFCLLAKKTNILINGSMGFKTLNIYIVVISWFFFPSRQSIISGTISLSLASEMSHILDFTMIAQSVRCPLLSRNRRFQTLQITGHTVCEINNTFIFISVCAWMHWNICHLFICSNTTLLYRQRDQLVIWRHFHLALFLELVHLQKC